MPAALLQRRAARMLRHTRIVASGPGHRHLPSRARAGARARGGGRIESSFELRFTTPEIAETLGMPLSTVGAVVARNGLGELPRLESEGPVNGYERPRPGELVHLEVKKLGRIGRPGHRVNDDRRTRSRGIGWEYVQVAVDDATRLA
jgi:hypothetical protein